MDWFHIHWRHVYGDIKRRERVVRGECSKKMVGSLIRQKKVRTPLQWQLRLRFQQVNWGRITQIQNTCLFSLNTRSVYRRYRLSRSTLKTFANKGWLSGVRKSSF